MSMYWPGYGSISGPPISVGPGSGEIEQATRTAHELSDRLDKLTLINMAMWELIKSRTNLTDTDLLAKVQELDLKDGVADGKVTRTVGKCPQCGRTMSPRHQRCLYCGYEKVVQTVFDSL